MLVEFSVTNFKSFKEKVTFSMVTDDKDKSKNDNYIKVKNTTLLKSAIIYGANASGKSNFIEAFLALKSLLENSTRNKKGDFIEEYKPYILANETISANTIFDIVFVRNTIVYHYTIQYNKISIQKESLYFFPNQKQTLLFKRENEAQYKFGTALKGQKKMIQQLTAHNQLYVSNGAENKMPQLMEVYDYLNDHFFVIPLLKDDILKDTRSIVAKLLYENPNSIFYKNFKLLITSLDTGILDIEIEKVKETQLINGKELNVNYRILTHHRYLNDDGTTGIQKFLIEQESTGTQKLIILAGFIIEALLDGRVCVIDEFERSLHPHISRFILSLFNNSTINKRNTQLIVATHDTELLSKENNLRRDQVWLMEKDNNGASDLFSLADMEGLRKDIPFDLWYLTNRFGGTPNIKSFNFQLKFEHELQA